ncbi:MAG: HslU--HslV peptidase proteolytic subunit [Planctomycetota bacterium]|nr:MAG: HslU--HslV peptidase proteolytic subunit [Planctomycetota bacterium]
MTTVLAVKDDNMTAIGADGQVTFGNSVMKSSALKVRRLYDNKVAVGFAGSVADAITLMEKFEAKLNSFSGNVTKSAIELAKDWRSDKILRKLESMMIVCDQTTLLILSGTGEVIEPDDNVVGIGSGGDLALSAARALKRNTKLSASEIVKESLKIASEICIYTNDNINIEEIKN